MNFFDWLFRRRKWKYTPVKYWSDDKTWKL